MYKGRQLVRTKQYHVQDPHETRMYIVVAI
jgi:hypothetical protein